MEDKTEFDFTAVLWESLSRTGDEGEVEPVAKLHLSGF